MKKDLRKIIAADLYRYGVHSERELSFMEKRELYGYRYTKIMRKAGYYKDNGNILRFYFYRYLLSILSVKYGFQISYATEIGAGLYLGHAGSIVVNQKVKMGKNVNLSQGVTIGTSNRGKAAGVPTIGDNVWIGSNATVVGGISIGDDVMIAPNTFVNFNVPAHSVVVMQKTTIIHRDAATQAYIENKVE